MTFVPPQFIRVWRKMMMFSSVCKHVLLFFDKCAYVRELSCDRPDRGYVTRKQTESEGLMKFGNCAASAFILIAALACAEAPNVEPTNKVETIATETVTETVTDQSDPNVKKLIDMAKIKIRVCSQ